MRSTCDLGGGCYFESQCGMFRRALDVKPSEYMYIVASRSTTRAKHYSYHTDNHNINEDIVTIANYGDSWTPSVFCGVFSRFLDCAPSKSLRTIASRLTLKRCLIRDTHGLSRHR